MFLGIILAYIKQGPIEIAAAIKKFDLQLISIELVQHLIQYVPNDTEGNLKWRKCAHDEFLNMVEKGIKEKYRKRIMLKTQIRKNKVLAMQMNRNVENERMLKY